MISSTYANNILTYLFAQKYQTLTTPTSLYIGLCQNEPSTDGLLANAVEPLVTNNGYKRIPLINYSEEKNSNGYVVSRDHKSFFFGPAKDGKITNSIEEIKFNAAQQDWGKMTYWFISTSVTGGSAILWGTIKDIIQEEISVDIPVDIQTGENGEKIVTTEIENDDLITLTENTQYIINFNETDYKVVSSEKSIITIGDESYVCLDFECLNAINGLDKDHPFKIKYWTSGNAIDGFKTYYRITSFINDDEAEQESITRKFGIFGIGINIKRNTVPTFFKGQLTAEIKISEE